MLRNPIMQRTVAALLVTTFTSLSLYPLTAAAQAKAAVERAGLLPKQKEESILENTKRFVNGLGGKQAMKPASTADERFAQLLAAIHEDLKAVVPQTAMPEEAFAYSGKGRGQDQQAAADGKKGGMETRAIGPNVRIETERSKETINPLPGTDVATRVKSIKSKAGELKGLYAEIDQSFRETEQHLKNAKLPQEILDRHTVAVGQYEARKAEFDRLMSRLEQGTNPNDQQVVLADLGSFMAKYPNAKPHQYTDPNKLPFGTPSGKVRAPMETKEQFQASLFPPKYDKVMLASTTLNGVKLAQATLPEAPVPADTAETEDAQITPAIQGLAVQLEKNPVKIYNWVRNNIAFIPSYGSIQGADMTLLNKRGNAFDTASLLIALYRASGIPARYVYGTIEVPADKVMNWVGGVTKAEAAQSLLGQGGIPNIAVILGGKITKIRMEHVWVEAYVDYTPSRGAVNRNPNTWVPMDPSFKQYTFTQGMDIKNKVPVDAQTLLAQVQQGATINSTQGYVQNLNQANLQNQLTTYQSQVKAYIESQKSNATVGDVVGMQTIAKEDRSIFLGSLPYRPLIIAKTFQSLPDNLKWQFKTNIYAADGVATSENPILEIVQNTARLAGKKITLSFVPATQADQDLINSYLPKPHVDGTPIQPSEWPSSLPGYLLKMKAEYRIDGKVVSQTTGTLAMGGTIRQATQYFNPGTGSWNGGEDNDVIVGEYNAIGMNLQGVSVRQLQIQQSRLESTNAKLIQYQQNPTDSALLNGLGKEDLTGDIVQAGILGYFANVDATDFIAAKSLGDITTYRLPSYGRFFISAQPRYWFGIVKNVTFPSVTMDVDYLNYHASAHDANHSTVLKFMKQAGVAGSIAEHSVPEVMFLGTDFVANDPAERQGISAAKALMIAAAQGQAIYTLNQSNIASLQNLQIDPDVKNEIRNALEIGKEVTVHEKNINSGSWTGCGYIIYDLDTGSGAYKISGGANGGSLDTIGNNSDALGFAFFVLGVIASVAVGGVVTFIVAIVALVISTIAFLAAKLEAIENAQCAEAIPCIEKIFLTVFLANLAMAALGLLVNPLVGLALGLLGLIWGDNVAKAASKGCNTACRSPA